MKVSIIIPVYNEAKTIGRVIRRVLDSALPAGFSREIIVVNDASTDRSLEVIKKFKSRLKLISHPVNQGKGAAVVSGLTKSSGEIVLIQDADLEYHPKYYVSLLQPFMSPRIKVVYGSRLINYPLRFLGKDKTPMPLHLIANRFLTLLTNLLYGVSVTDMETGYKVMSAPLLRSLNLKSKRFDLEPEITAKILKKGVKIIEIPIKVRPRSYAQGKKIGLKDGLIAIWTLIKYRFVA